MGFATTISQLTQQSGIDAAEARREQAKIAAAALTSNAEAQSHAAAAKGAIWGSAISNIGNSIAEIPAQMAKTKALNLQAQDVQAQIDERKAHADKVKQEDAESQAVDRAFEAAKRPDGTIDEQLFLSNIPGSKQQVYAPLVKNIVAAQEADKQKKESVAAHAFVTAHELGTPASLVTAAKMAVAAKSMTPEDLAQVQQIAGAIASGPVEAQEGSTRNLAAYMGSHFPQFQDLLNENISKKAGLAKTQAETSKANAEAAKLNAETAGTLPQKPTAEADKKRYLDIQSRVVQKMPIPPEDAAFAQAYEKEKTLATDTSASAAADRQANAIGAQVAQQGRAQTFQEQQAGRRELTDKVEKPYLDAKAAAATLRDTVAAAKAGNKFAGSMQQAEAAMTAMRAQGFSRIPNAEFKAAGDAGNLWDNISGWVGKRAEGQPVPPDIQRDMSKFADIVEQVAYKRYVEAHKSTAGRYKLDEKPMAGPDNSASMRREIPGHPGKFAVSTDDGKTWKAE
jgi:hypothetical protein